MNWTRLAAQLVRARRGARTQKQLSRALGYSSNVLFAWESERDVPSARKFFQLARRTGAVRDLSVFMRSNPAPDLCSRSGVAQFLKGLLGSTKVVKLAEALGRDRYVVGRWLRGQTEIPLPDLLQLIEQTTLAIYDFLAAFADPHALEEAAAGYRRLEAARESAKQKPWSHAIVHMVDLPSYSRLAKHERGWFASRLGISIQDEEECLKLLLTMGRLELCGGRYRSTDTLNVDTRRDPAATRQLAAFWMRQGATRVLTPGSGRFAFNTFAISSRDLERAKELQSEYFRQLRTLVAESESAEAVAVATFQLFTLAEERS